MVSPPKPWERGAVAASATPLAATPAAVSLQTSNPAVPRASAPPSGDAVPERPPALPSTITSPSSLAVTNPSSLVQANPYSSYASPLSRFGTGYSPYTPTYGSYGSMGMGTYGGYGSSYGGYGGIGSYGGYGMGLGVPGVLGANGLQAGLPGSVGTPTLTQTLESTTHQTFALLHSLVQTFAGVAQMLESTFFATHSSFFAVVGVVDQFGQLRDALAGVLGLFGLVRWLRDRIRVLSSGRSALRDEFRDFVQNGRSPPAISQGPSSSPGAPRPSKKPLIVFLLAVFGIPYAMARLVRALKARQVAAAAAAAAGSESPPTALPGPPPSLGQIDPSTLQFARALYPFRASTAAELGLKENEIVAVMGKLDPASGAEVDPRWEGQTEWWRGRTRDGREGWFPSKWVELLQRKVEPKKVD